MIINLKFEDIEKKMMSTSDKSDDDTDLFAKVEAVSLDSNGHNKKRKESKDKKDVGSKVKQSKLLKHGAGSKGKEGGNPT